MNLSRTPNLGISSPSKLLLTVGHHTTASARRATAVFALAVVTASCTPTSSEGTTRPPAPTKASVPPTGSSPAPTALGSYTDDDVRRHVDELADDLKINAPQRAELKEKLDRLLASEPVRTAALGGTIRGVATFRMGEGGAIVKFGQGDGVARFAAADQHRPFEMKATSIGAQIGGSSTWGVIVIVGLRDVSSFEGTYTGDFKGATAVDLTTGSFQLEHEMRGHRLYFVDVAAGLSANAGKLRLVIGFTR